MEQNIIVSIYKEGNSLDCNNYRAICLSIVILNVFSDIMEKRLRKQIENQLEEEQGAYRKGRQTQDHIFTIRTVIEKAKTINKPLYMSFLDLKSAFDTVPKLQLWKSLTEFDVDTKLKTIMQSLYEYVYGLVRINGVTSKPFQMKRGIKQGDCLSPLLFTLTAQNTVLIT
jgi:hypothetical protein